MARTWDVIQMKFVDGAPAMTGSLGIMDDKRSNPYAGSYGSGGGRAAEMQGSVQTHSLLPIQTLVIAPSTQSGIPKQPQYPYPYRHFLSQSGQSGPGYTGPGVSADGSAHAGASKAGSTLKPGSGGY